MADSIVPTHYWAQIASSVLHEWKRHKGDFFVNKGERTKFTDAVKHLLTLLLDLWWEDEELIDMLSWTPYLLCRSWLLMFMYFFIVSMSWNILQMTTYKKMWPTRCQTQLLSPVKVLQAQCFFPISNTGVSYSSFKYNSDASSMFFPTSKMVKVPKEVFRLKLEEV